MSFYQRIRRTFIAARWIYKKFGQGLNVTIEAAPPTVTHASPNALIIDLNFIEQVR